MQRLRRYSDKPRRMFSKRFTIRKRSSSTQNQMLNSPLFESHKTRTVGTTGRTCITTSVPEPKQLWKQSSRRKYRDGLRNWSVTDNKSERIKQGCKREETARLHPPFTNGSSHLPHDIGTDWRRTHRCTSIRAWP
ncbi:hypothetical protein M758_UG094400 [Ceratodon purpureus]|nr:hypothetical protein M758_UG094400 [Ceratodon purpureus]